MNFFISALCALLFAFTHAKVSYDGYKVLRIALGANEADAEKVNALVTNLDLDIWTHTIAPNRNVDVQVPPEKLSAFLSGLGEIPYSTMYEDLGAAIREESDAIASAEGEQSVPWNMLLLKQHSRLADRRHIMVQFVSLV
jgi:hypothetical protein